MLPLKKSHFSSDSAQQERRSQTGGVVLVAYSQSPSVLLVAWYWWGSGIGGLFNSVSPSPPGVPPPPSGPFCSPYSCAVVSLCPYINNETRPPAVVGSVGWSRVERGDRSQALCLCISHLYSTAQHTPRGSFQFSPETPLRHSIDLFPKKAQKNQQHQAHSPRGSVCLLLYNVCTSMGLPSTYCIMDALHSPRSLRDWA